MTAASPDAWSEPLSADPRLAGWLNLQYVPEVDSTNTHALRLAATGAPEGTAVLADRQHAGRGRRGHSWFSPPGAGVYLSVIVRPPSAALPLVTLAAGTAAATAVTRASGLPVELKWPNDLVVGRPWRKLGGLLCETSSAGGRVDAVVVGIGLNVRPAAYPPDIAGRATALESELGRAIDRRDLVCELLAGLRATVAQLAAGDLDAVRARWRELGRAGLHGAPVRWQDQHGGRRGLARDIDDEGALLVDTAEGVVRLTAGEVTWDRVR